MHATRELGWVLAGASLLMVFGCDGGGGCVFDSDCADVTQVCIERQCRPAGAVPEGGMPDSGPRADAGGRPDAGRPDAGGTDAGGEDAGAEDAGPACFDASGTWQVASIDTGDGTCGTAVLGAQTSITAASVECAFSANSSGVTLDGDFTTDADGVIATGGTVAMLTAGGDATLVCTGTATSASLSLSCGPTGAPTCTMQLTPVTP